MLNVINYTVIEYLLSSFVCTFIDQSKFWAQSVKTTQKIVKVSESGSVASRSEGASEMFFHQHHLCVQKVQINYITVGRV